MNGLANLVIAVATAAAALVAIIALWHQISRSRYTLQIDLLLKREELFEGKWMRALRRKAAESLLKRNAEDKNRDEVLEFFETLGYLTRRKALDKEAVWIVFFYWLHRYMYAAKDYVKADQKEDPTTWDNAVWLHSCLEAMEKRKRQCSHAQIALSEDDLGEFLKEESQLAGE